MFCFLHVHCCDVSVWLWSHGLMLCRLAGLIHEVPRLYLNSSLLLQYIVSLLLFVHVTLRCQDSQYLVCLPSYQLTSGCDWFTFCHILWPFVYTVFGLHYSIIFDHRSINTLASWIHLLYYYFHERGSVIYVLFENNLWILWSDQSESSIQEIHERVCNVNLDL